MRRGVLVIVAISASVGCESHPPPPRAILPPPPTWQEVHAAPSDAGDAWLSQFCSACPLDPVTGACSTTADAGACDRRLCCGEGLEPL